MPVTCTPDDLAESINCLSEQNKQVLLAEIVYLLCQLNSMECDPDTLAESSNCLSQWNEGALLGAAVFLLCELTNGGGLGSGVLSDGAVDPVAAPTNPAVTNWYTNTATGTAWIWPAGGAVWQQIV